MRKQMSVVNVPILKQTPRYEKSGEWRKIPGIFHWMEVSERLKPRLIYHDKRAHCFIHTQGRRVRAKSGRITLEFVSTGNRTRLTSRRQ